MQTNQLNWSTDLIRTAYGIVEQIQSWPSSVLLLICLILFGMVIYSLSLGFSHLGSKTNHQKFSEWLYLSSVLFRDVAPISVIFLGTFMNLYVGEYGKIDENQRHPDMILGMWGFCIGCVAWIVAWMAFRKFKKRLPSYGNGNGDTEALNKEDKP